jgi:uncharacterized protein
VLIEFRVENHRSIRDEQALTMEEGRVSDPSDARPRTVPGFSKRLLPVSALYGANGSGKSNVLSAFGFVRDAVIESHNSWPPNEGVPRDSFAWGPRRTEPSFFELTFLVNGTRFQYGFVASDDRFLEEWLNAWPKAKKQMWFERDADIFKFGDKLRGENTVIQGLTRPNALFLSAAAQLNHHQLEPVFSWIKSIETFNLPISKPLLKKVAYVPNRTITQHAFEAVQSLSSGMQTKGNSSDEPCLVTLREFLRTADLGIVDLKVADSESMDEARRRGDTRFELRHGSEDNDAWLPLDEESRGTQLLFRLSVPISQALRRGGLVLVDELESSLHPTLARQIVSRFNDLETNPHNAQLIFTTHDTNLLGSTVGDPILRRDQVWLTEKNKIGATELYPLTDFKPRKAENLERGYLQGRYGAIPFLGNLNLTGK